MDAMKVLDICHRYRDREIDEEEASLQLTTEGCDPDEVLRLLEQYKPKD